jgi:hypothetical protein
MFTQKQFMHEMTVEWEALQKALNNIPVETMDTPVKAGEWSVKDILAHLTWYERQMIGVVGQRALVGSDLWNLPLDERNYAIYVQLKEKTTAEVLTESVAVHAQLMALLQGLSDDELNQPPLFKDMPPHWIPGDLIASNTYEHYRAHLRSIQDFKG